MACLEHHCRDCGNQWFDNKASTVCIRCGSTNVSDYFDEDLADHSPDGDYENYDSFNENEDAY